MPAVLATRKSEARMLLRLQRVRPSMAAFFNDISYAKDACRLIRNTFYGGALIFAGLGAVDALIFKSPTRTTLTLGASAVCLAFAQVQRRSIKFYQEIEAKKPEGQGSVMAFLEHTAGQRPS